MATFTLTNSAGFGFNMSAAGHGGYYFASIDGSIQTNYLGNSDYNTAVYEVSGNALGEIMVLDYTEKSTGILVNNAFYGWENASEASLSIVGVNIFVTYEDLMSGATDWFIQVTTLNDTFYGNRFNDVIHAGLGNDRVFGSGGNDRLYGDDGTDKLYGGVGADSLYGGRGKDAFVFDQAPASGKDTIRDFVVVDDTIYIDNADFTRIGSSGTLKASAFHVNNTGKAHDSSDRIIYDKDSGILYYDADGSGSGASVAFATISKNLALTYMDLLVV